MINAFKISKPHCELKTIRDSFEEYRDYFVQEHEHYYHVSKLQIHVVCKGRSVGIAPWPQFLPTILPYSDYVLISFTDGDFHHVHIGETDKLLQVIRHLGFTKHKEPIEHLRLPHVLDKRWQARILQNTHLLETTTI